MNWKVEPAVWGMGKKAIIRFALTALAFGAAK
jgi:hypothetical protein